MNAFSRFVLRNIEKLINAGVQYRISTRKNDLARNKTAHGTYIYRI